MKTNSYRNACLIAMLVFTPMVLSAGEPRLAAAPGGDQANTEPNADSSLEEVVVTGTLIRNPNIEKSSPVSVIGEQEIAFRQSNVAEELLRVLPGSVPGVGPGIPNGTDGAATVNLRNLGDARNLVLLDGARLTPYGLQGVSDLDNIPLALIERVDVLTGGATTTYGADAVSGVVNFITRRDFSGLQLDVTDQLDERGDGNTLRVDLTLGGRLADGRGHAAFSVGYQKADGLRRRDRDFSYGTINSSTGILGGISGNTVPGRFSLPGQGTLQLDTSTGALVPTYFRYDTNQAGTLQTPFKRFNIFGTGSFDLNDRHSFYAEALFSNNQVNADYVATHSSGAAVDIPYSNPYLPDAARAQFCGAHGLTPAQCDAAAAATVPTDPNYRTFTTALARRFVETGGNKLDFDSKIFQIKGGLRGNLTEQFKYDIHAMHGESDLNTRLENNALYSRLRQALLATNPDTCLNNSGGCVPLNVFGPPGSVTPDQLAFLVGGPANTETSSELSSARGVISGDTGFTSPFAGNPTAVAVGGEYRKYTAHLIPDSAGQMTGELLANGDQTQVQGSYHVADAFAELVAPLVEDRPFAKNITLELGARHSDYSTLGNSSTWKTGGSWTPATGFKLRGNYQIATRAPNINELFTPQFRAFGNLGLDPCAGPGITPSSNLGQICVAQGAPAATLGGIENPAMAIVTLGGNPGLDVEEGRTYSIGMVFEPQSFRNLTGSVDYYHITIEDAISSPTAGDVVSACFDPAYNPSLAVTSACTAIERDPLTGSLNGNPGVMGGLPLVLSNLGRLETDGVDLKVDYRAEFGFAALSLGFQGNWTRSSKFQATPSALDRECVGYYSVNCISIQPDYSWQQRSTLRRGNLDVSLFWRHISSVQYEPQALIDGGGTFPLAAFRHIGARDYFDLSTGLHLETGLRFSLLVQNLLDKEPPIIGASTGSFDFNNANTYPQTYDVHGRRYGLTVSYSF